MKNGFTLIELAVTLVIVGLLIGGVLIAQSLVESSKLNAQVSQIQQFDTAVATFYTKFKQIPGDSEVHGGDGDGILEGLILSNPWSGAYNLFGSEQANFWAQAFPGEYASSAYHGPGNSCTTLTNSGSNPVLPKAEMGSEKGGFVASRTHPGIDNYYSVTNIDSQSCVGWTRYGRSNGENNSVFTTLELYSLDKKMDDGLADSGDVLSGSFHRNSTYEYPSYANTEDCSSGSDYDLALLALEGYECTPLIKIGILTGEIE